MSTPKLVQKRFAEYREPLVETPPPIEMQLASYKQLLEKGVTEVFEEFANIKDYSGKKFELKFVGFRLDPPSFDELHAKAQKLTYETPMRATLKLVNKVMNEEKEQEIFLSDFPLMTSHGTFIVNGVERVVVPQLARSYGVFFNAEDVRGRRYFGAKVVPVRGAWIEIETEADGVIYVRIDRRRKFPISSLLRVLGQGKTDADIKAAFVDLASDVPYIENSFAKDHAKNADDAHVEIYRRLRDNDLATPASAREFITAMFAPERYDLSPVGRFHFNKRFEKPMDAQALAQKTLNFDDLVSIVRHVITLNTTPEAEADDIDHLGLRRVRLVGEMLQLKLRQGLSQMKRHIQDRMSTIDTSTTLPVQIVNPRALQARIKEFFTTNQLSQFMRQENVLSELEHLRRLSALGAGGLTRERAGFEVRDVHTSHYGRVCPIQTPEGPNIGLILTLSSYARINDFGIIETPYAKVKNGKVTKEIEYINALAEENFNIAHAGIPLSADGTIEVAEVEARVAGEPVWWRETRLTT